MSRYIGLVASALALITVGAFSIGQRPPPAGGAAPQIGGRPPQLDWHFFHQGTKTYRYNSYNGDMELMMTSDNYKWGAPFSDANKSTGTPALGRFEVSIGDNPNVDILRMDCQTGVTWVLINTGGQPSWSRLGS